ncbi:MAG: selB [Phycisphaerales bacterium]|nr:selB [Phycisphaerales bacterium]
MPTPSYIVATAGHVDHGKSALVKAITGTDPDRLPEEKARGITIELGFAHVEVAAMRDGKPTPLRLAIVDVPGHEDFVKNMVAGVGSVDLALFVVAADDGWMPQTEEHLQILTYLGVTRAVVALTKIDLAESPDAITLQIRGKLAGTPFANAPIVPTSVITGSGIEQLKQTLADALADAQPQRDVGKPRLSVDRAFTLRGVGTVVTGTLIDGSFTRGQAVVVQPSGRPAKIRTIQSHNREVELIPPGRRAALNLPDLKVADKSAALDAPTARRGDVITLATLGKPSDTLDVVIERTARDASEQTSRPLKDGARLHLHLGSGDFPARLLMLDRPALSAGERTFAQIRTDSPLFAFLGDRFILRDWPEQHTLAGGVVLDPEASPKSFRSTGRRAQLEAIDRSMGDAPSLLAAHLAKARVAHRSSLLLRSRFSNQEIADALARLAVDGKTVVFDTIAADAGWWKQMRQVAIEAIDAEHKAHPERSGLALSDLRQHLTAHHIEPVDVFEALIGDLVRDGFIQAGTAIRRSSHRPALPPNLQPAGARIRAALTAKPWDPPSRKELTPDNVAFQAMKFLLNTGEAIEIGDELVLHADHYQRAIGAIKTHIMQRGPATVSELRQALATSRRIMVPLLEKLDRDGITARQGDKRTLRQPKTGI